MRRKNREREKGRNRIEREKGEKTEREWERAGRKGERQRGREKEGRNLRTCRPRAPRSIVLVVAKSRYELSTGRVAAGTRIHVLQHEDQLASKPVRTRCFRVREMKEKNQRSRQFLFSFRASWLIETTMYRFRKTRFKVSSMHWSERKSSIFWKRILWNYIRNFYF